MRTIERILFTTPTNNGEITEMIIKGFEYGDFGMCSSIVQIEDGSYRAYFPETKSDFTVKDVKRILCKDE